MSVILVNAKKMFKRVRRVAFSALIILFAMFFVFKPVIAMTNAEYDIYSRNDIYFYTPEECIELGSSTARTGGSSNGSDVLVIGDSISTDVYGGSEIKAALPNAIVDAVGSSGINYDGHNAQGGEVRSGINRLRDHLNELNSRGVLVFAMGTNGGVSDSDINALFETVSGKDIKIVLMTIFNPNATGQVSSSNEVVKRTAEEYDNVSYMDWYAVASSDPDKYVAIEGQSRMQVHPTQEGQNKFAEIMKEAVDKVTVQKNTAVDTSSVNYYNPNYNRSDEPGFDHWTGDCYSVSSYEGYLSERADLFIKLGQEMGFPWEVLAAQTIGESGGNASPVAMKCNNPLGLTTMTPTSCPYYKDGADTPSFYYQEFASIEDSYRAWGSKTAIVQMTLDTGNFASSPFSFVEYLQYGVSGAAYAVCGADWEKYPHCKGQQGKPTPKYVQLISAFICGIQKWAIEHDKPISEENFTNYDTPYRTIMADGSTDTSKIKTTGSGGTTKSCEGGSSGGDFTNSDGVTTTEINGYTYAFPIAGATKANYLRNTSELKAQYSEYGNVSVQSAPTRWYHHDKNYSGGNQLPSADMGIAYKMTGAADRGAQYYIDKYNSPGSSGSNKDYPYYASSGAKVVATIGGTLHWANESRNGYSFCSDLYINGDDGHTWNYIHILRDDSLYSRESRRVETGEVISEIGTPECADTTQSHLHFMIDNSTSSIDIATYLNPLFDALPANASELARRASKTEKVEEGGLTYEQAKKFMINYGANKNGSSEDAVGSHMWNDLCGGGGSNCVTFSAFFLNKFTSTSSGEWPNGKNVVATLGERGAETGDTPRVWAVFSWDNGTELGHTGVILGYYNDEWIVGHASCTRGENGSSGAGDGTLTGGGSGWVEVNSDITAAVRGDTATRITYAYFDGDVNTNAISNYLTNGT